MPWSNTATNDLVQVQGATGANAAEIGALRAQIDAWANANPPQPDGNRAFPFGQHPNHGVTANKMGTLVRTVQYG